MDPACHEFVSDPRGDRLALRRVAAWLLRYAPVVAIDGDLSSVPIDAPIASAGGVSGADLTASEGAGHAQTFGESDPCVSFEGHRQGHRQGHREARRRAGRRGAARGGSISESDAHAAAAHGGRAVLLADLTGCERLLRQTYGMSPHDDCSRTTVGAPRRADGTRAPSPPPSSPASSSAAPSSESAKTAADTRWAEWSLAEEIVTRLGRTGITARAAVASTVGVVWAMATSSSASVPIAVIEPGRERDALAPLPIEALRLDPEHTAALREVQVERIGQLLALDRTDLGERFGRTSHASASPTSSRSRGASAGSRRTRTPARLSAQACDDVLRCIDRACGRIPEPLHGVRIAPACRAVREFDGPTVDHDAIAIVVADLIDQLCALLRTRQRGVRLLRLEAFRPSVPSVVIDVHFGAATRRRGHLWSLLSPRLETLDKGDGIDRLVLSAVRVARLGVTQGHMRLSRGAMLHETSRENDGLLSAARPEPSPVRTASDDHGRTSVPTAWSRLARSASVVECIDAISARFGPTAVRCPAPRGLHTPEHFAALLPAHDLAALVDAYERVSWSNLPTPMRPTVVFATPEPALVTPSLAPFVIPSVMRPGIAERTGADAHADSPAVTLTWRGTVHTLVAVSADERIDEAWWHARDVPLPQERDSAARSPLTYVTRVYRRVATAHGLWLWMWQPTVTAGAADSGETERSRVVGAGAPSHAWAAEASVERWFVHGVWA